MKMLGEGSGDSVEFIFNHDVNIIAIEAIYHKS